MLQGSLSIAALTGTGLGFLLCWLIVARRQGKRRHANELRWRRRLEDAREELQAQRARHHKASDDAGRREQCLERALAESEETVRLLSDDKLPAFEAELELRNARIMELETEASSLRAQLADEKDDQALLARRIEKLTAELEQRTAQLGDFRQYQATIAELRRRVGDYEQQMSGYDVQLRRRDEHIARLDREFTALRTRLPALDDALREREASIEDLVAELGRQRQRFASLQQRLAKSQARRLQVESRAGKIIELSQHRWGSEQEAAHSEAGAADAARATADNLRRVRGIGPAIERALNRNGVYNYTQLASLGKDRIAWLEERMPGIGKRIARDDWIAQARKLSGRDPGGIRSG